MNRNNLTSFVFLAIGLLFCLPGRLQGQVMGNFSVQGVTSFQASSPRGSNLMGHFNRYSVGASGLTAEVSRTAPNPFSVSLRQSMTDRPSFGAAAKGGLRSRFGMMDSTKMPNNFSHLLDSLPTSTAGSASAGQLQAMPSFRSRSLRTNAFTTKADELGKPFLQSRRNSLTTGFAFRKSRLGINRLGRSRLTGHLTTELTQGLTRSLTHPTTLYNTGSNLPSRAQSRTRRGLSREKIGLKKFRNRK